MTTDTLVDPAVGTKVTIERRNDAGELLDLVDLDPTIFGVTPNVPLMHQVVTAQLAARRSGTQSTKTRAEVAGGGAKPYRQKGTGRARQGTIRAPQFAGGGVALGPKPRSYAQRTPRKMIRLALHSALSDRAAEGRICLVDEWSFEVPKTKDAVRALGDLGLTGRILVVLGPNDTVAERCFANLQRLSLVEGTQLTAYEVLANDWVLFTSETIPGEVTVSEASEPTVRSAASAPDGETAAGADTSADASGTADADEADAAASATQNSSAADDDEAGVDSDAADAEAEARAHDIAVSASGEPEDVAGAEIATIAVTESADDADAGEPDESADAAGSADETAVLPSSAAEAGATSDTDDETAVLPSSAAEADDVTDADDEADDGDEEEDG